jgi:hypothetical protein
MEKYYIANEKQSPELYHYGILGMKWGIRRYQNEDGSLTPAGRKRYGSKEVAEVDKKMQEISQKNLKARYDFKYAINRKENDRKALADEMLKIVERKYPDYKEKIKARDELAKQFDSWVLAHESGEAWARDKSVENKMDGLGSRVRAYDQEINAMSEKIAKEFLGKIGNEEVYGIFGYKTSKSEEFIRYLKYNRHW